MRARFGFAVLHYLAPETTKACVSRILSLRQDPPELTVAGVVIVDNASPDGSGCLLAEKYRDDPRITVLHNEENIGFARGNNTGYTYLKEHIDPDFIVMLNNDVMIDDPDFLSLAAAAYTEHPYGVLGPDIFCPGTGEHQSPSHTVLPGYEQLTTQQQAYDRANRFFPLQYARMKKSGKKAVPSASAALSETDPVFTQPADNVVLHGACYVFSKDFITKRDYAFSPRTFLYMEEDILAYECLKAGIAMRYDPRIRVEHIGDVSTTARYRSDYRRAALKYREKARSMQILRDMMAEDRTQIYEHGKQLFADSGSAGQDPAGPGAVGAGSAGPGAVGAGSAGSGSAAPDSAGLFLSEQIGDAFAGNSVNGSIFRKNALVSYYDPAGTCFRFCCFYGPDAQILIAQKTGNAPEWDVQATRLYGDYSDAHNSLSLAVDGDGFLHLAQCAHNGTLFCTRSREPLSCSFPALGEAPVSPLPEAVRAMDRITYPEFYLQPSGDLFLLCRNGRSGDGRMVLCRYLTKEKSWQLLSDDLLADSGAGPLQGSPYWQACTDPSGRLHISYTLRRTPDASTNHDVYYLVSVDETGRSFSVPEQILQIPEGSGLVNQTSMTADENGVPSIAALFRKNGIMQYFLVTRRPQDWVCCDTGIRTTDFSLGGRGTQFLPCARPLLLSLRQTSPADISRRFLLVTRDEEDGGRLCASVLEYDPGPDDMPADPAALCRVLSRTFLTDRDTGSLEPCFDPAAWQKEQELCLYVQYTCHAPDHRLWLTCGTPAYILRFHPEELS